MKRHAFPMLQAISRLFRPRLALLNGVAAAGGYALFPAADYARLAASCAGVALLAAAGSAFNQVLERDLDVLMERTRKRPLPMGQLSVSAAVVIALAVALAGCLALALAGGLTPVLLGLAALAWYLAVYTRLKRVSCLALLPGALCGAFPPLIGWCMAGGTPLDYRIIMLAGLLFLWQIPHFWLLQERYAAEYRRAGIPLLETAVGPAGRSPFFWLWLLSFVAGAMLLPAFGLIGRPAAPWYAAFQISLVLLALTHSRRLLFACLNLFPVLVTVILFIHGT